MEEQNGAGRGEQVPAQLQFMIRAAAAAAESAGRALHVSSPCCVPAMWTTQAHLPGKARTGPLLASLPCCQHMKCHDMLCYAGPRLTLAPPQ